MNKFTQYVEGSFAICGFQVDPLGPVRPGTRVSCAGALVAPRRCFGLVIQVSDPTARTVTVWWYGE